MSTREKPHYTLIAENLAEWIESQPEAWWLVDGDPELNSTVDFPCPSDELAPEIRKFGRKILVKDWNPQSQARGEEIAGDKLNHLYATTPRSHRKLFQMCWEGSDIDWLLIEDEPLLP